MIVSINVANTHTNTQAHHECVHTQTAFKALRRAEKSNFRGRGQSIDIAATCRK